MKNHENYIETFVSQRLKRPERRWIVLKSLAEFDLVELLDQPTHIPKNIRGASVATTDPDCVMTTCCHNESVEMVSRDTLRSDHLAFIVKSDFKWPSRDPTPPKYGHFFEYSKLTLENTENEWDGCVQKPEHDDIWGIFKKILMKIRKPRLSC